MTDTLLERLAYYEGMLQELVDLELHSDDRGYRTITIDEVGFDEEGRPVLLLGTLDTWSSLDGKGEPLPDDMFRRGQASPLVIGEHEGAPTEYTNIDRSLLITARIAAIDDMMAELRRTFAERELEGGWKAALEHPLWQAALDEKDDLREQLTQLV